MQNKFRREPTKFSDRLRSHLMRFNISYSNPTVPIPVKD